MIDPLGLAGKGNGGVGNSSGIGTNNPYKHCKIDSKDPNYIICKDPNGKTVRKKKPKDWPENKNKIQDCLDPNDWGWKNDPGNPINWSNQPSHSNQSPPPMILPFGIPVW